MYLPLEYRDTPLKTTDWTHNLLKQALKRYGLDEIFESKMIPVCSDGALSGVGKQLESSECMSHKHNRVTQTWLTHNDYLTPDMALYWKNLQNFWNSSNHAPNDKTVYFNKWLKSNQKPTEMDIEYLSDWMNEKLTLKGKNDKI